MTRDYRVPIRVTRVSFAVGRYAERWPRRRSARWLGACVAVCGVALLGGCGSGDSVPSGRWASAFSGTTSMQLSDDGSATIDFGADGVPTCIDSGAGVSDVGEWHGIGAGWYEAKFDTFNVEFAFDVWFDKTNYDKMFLVTCGNRDEKVTMARQ